MKDKPSATYSLWLTPDVSTVKKAKAIIDGLSSVYKSIPFEPHVTLLGSIKGDESDIVARAKRLAGSMDPLKLGFDGVAHEDQYFKCVFMKVKKNAKLQEAYDKALLLFNSQKKEFMPYLSLIYAKLPEKTRLEIKGSLEKGTLKDLSGFYADILKVEKTEGEVDNWRSVKSFRIMG